LRKRRHLLARRGLSPSSWLLTLVTTVAAVFLIGPAVVVMVDSFSNDQYIDFPPHSWGIAQYRSLWHSGSWHSAIETSLAIAFPAAALSVAIASLAALGVHRTRIRARAFLEIAGLSSLLIPISAYAVAMYGVFVQLHLLGTRLGLIVADSVLAVPLVLVVLGGSLLRVPRDLELAAMSLGARRWRAWVGITLRILVPALLTGYLFAFLTSFDEAVFVTFLGGPGLVTLPKAIFDSVRFGVDPTITAIAALLMLITAAFVAATAALSRRGLR